MCNDLVFFSWPLVLARVMYPPYGRQGQSYLLHQSYGQVLSSSNTEPNFAHMSWLEVMLSEL
jgi:hypothetical protein